MADSGPAGDDPSGEPARMLAALDLVPAGAVLLKPVRDDDGALVDLVFAYANRRALQIAGVRASQVYGQRVLEALPSCPAQLFEGFAATLAGGEPLRTQHDYSDMFAGGPRFSGHFDVTASRLGDALLVVFENVGARARERRFEAVLEATSDWVSIADPDQHLVYINEGGRRMVGIGLDEDIRGRRIGEFSPAWARDHVRHVVLPIVRRNGVWRGNGGRRHRDGHEIPVSQVIVAGRDADGEVEFYATIARDMTSEQAAEKALRASEERFRVAFEQAPIGFALLDLEGRYVQVNDAYCRTVRRAREELTMRSPASITHPDDIADSAHAIRRLVDGEITEYSFEKRYLAPDGESIWAELNATVFRDNDGRPQFLIGMIQGIGERRVAQTLQRSMLTTQLPEIPGAEVAVMYLPGSRETQVCGDWYDVIPLPDGRFGVVIGDVVGRGIEAAATMSQLRTALRAYAIDGLQPAEVVRKLHGLVDHLDEGLGTTLVYFDLDPATREMRYVSAGHLPPLLVDAAGVPTFLQGGRSTPLGTLLEGVDVPQDELALNAGDTVLLYTDGLVERRDEGIIARLHQLQAALACAPASLDACLEHVTTSLTGDAVRFDDIALLALRAR
ncbi:MAG TPA: SpoIIE family protein phosphatase [Solirubrobacteraceae bacterium]|nr:SpoIIE family protein phosphatase [Solirubrobacteraceae bacterium]